LLDLKNLISTQSSSGGLALLLGKWLFLLGALKGCCLRVRLRRRRHADRMNFATV
jgi:hypothetical protein